VKSLSKIIDVDLSVGMALASTYPVVSFMPRIFRANGDEFNQRFNRKNAAPGNEFVGFQSNGAVVVRDRRGTLESEIPDMSTKSETMGDDPLAIYKPTCAKSFDAAKAMGNFTGWLSQNKFQH
jgi:hypothetical protein